MCIAYTSRHCGAQAWHPRNGAGAAQAGSALAQHDELVEVDERHPVVLVAVMHHAGVVEERLVVGLCDRLERDKARVDEVLQLLDHLARRRVGVLGEVDVVYAQPPARNLRRFMAV